MAEKDSPARSTLVIARTFDAPRKLVWQAWTDPKMVVKWWGPRAFTCPVARIDFRVGGTCFSAMKGAMPDGTEVTIWSTGVYKEIVPLEKIVVTDSFADEKGNVVPASHYGMEGEFPLEMLITVTFKEEKGKTTMTLRHEGMAASEEKEATGGWNESFDKLVELLAAA